MWSDRIEEEESWKHWGSPVHVLAGRRLTRNVRNERDGREAEDVVRCAVRGHGAEAQEHDPQPLRDWPAPLDTALHRPHESATLLFVFFSVRLHANNPLREFLSRTAGNEKCPCCSAQVGEEHHWDRHREGEEHSRPDCKRLRCTKRGQRRRAENSTRRQDAL